MKSKISTDLAKFYDHCIMTDQLQVAELIKSAVDEIRKLEVFAVCAHQELNEIDERECSKDAWDSICNAADFIKI